MRAAALSRVEEINRLKSRGYSLALIREKLEDRPAGFMPLDLGLDGASFSRGRHALVIMADMDEYASFARKFIGNALRANQAVMLVADPAHRTLYETILREEGFDLDIVMKRRQVCFAWFEGKEHLDHHRQIEQYDALVQMIRNAGWQNVRILGQPEREGLCFDDSSVERYEERLTLWARALACDRGLRLGGAHDRSARTAALTTRPSRICGGRQRLHATITAIKLTANA